MGDSGKPPLNQTIPFKDTVGVVSSILGIVALLFGATYFLINDIQSKTNSATERQIATNLQSVKEELIKLNASSKWLDENKQVFSRVSIRDIVITNAHCAHRPPDIAATIRCRVAITPPVSESVRAVSLGNASGTSFENFVFTPVKYNNNELELIVHTFAKIEYNWVRSGPIMFFH